MPPGKKKDHKWGGHTVCHVYTGLWHVRGAPEDLPAEVQRGETPGLNGTPLTLIIYVKKKTKQRCPNQIRIVSGCEVKFH